MEMERDFSKYTNAEYNDFVLSRQHPMCRCRCTPMIKIKDIYFTPSTKYLIWEYSEECNEKDIWIN